MSLKLNYQLMQPEEVTATLDRMAEEILKTNDGRPVVLIGIQRRGVPMARRIAIRMAEKTMREPQIGTLDINLYRDDLTRVASQPVVQKTEVPPNIDGAFVITSSGGLVSPDAIVTLERLQEISSGNLDPKDPYYRRLLERDAQSLAGICGKSCEIVLLGSIATPKYVEPLLTVFGEHLMFPAEFVGRGDMSRGGLMLRRVQSGESLTYVPLLGATRHGPRPPKLAPLPRKLTSSVACAIPPTRSPNRL